jgi:hypothetical protein
MRKIIFAFSALAMLVLVMATTGCNSSAKRQQAIADSIARADSIAKADSIANVAKMIEEQAPVKIKEFYDKYVFGTTTLNDENVKEYCTEKLNKKLHEAYENIGNAIMKFRNEGPIGNSDGQFLTDVERLGDGKYKACYIDWGVSQSAILTVVVVDGKVLMDEIEKK